jgi:hypothetical protein
MDSEEYKPEEDPNYCGFIIEVEAERDTDITTVIANTAILMVTDGPEPGPMDIVAGIYVGSVIWKMFNKSESSDDDSNVEDDSDKKSKSKIWEKLKPFRGKTKTNGKKGKKKEYYEWDHTHNDIEVYNHRGEHKGSIDPNSGEYIKPPVPGRRINL